METCPGEKLFLVVGYSSRDDGVMGKGREEGTRMEEKEWFLNPRVYFPCDTAFQRTGPIVWLERAEYFSRAMLTVTALLMCLRSPETSPSKPSSQLNPRGYPTRASTWATLSIRPLPLRTWWDQPACRGQAAERETPSQTAWFWATGKQISDCRCSGLRVGIAKSYPGLQRGMLLKTLWSIKLITPSILLPSITGWDGRLFGFCAHPHWA